MYSNRGMGDWQRKAPYEVLNSRFLLHPGNKIHFLDRFVGSPAIRHRLTEVTQGIDPSP